MMSHVDELTQVASKLAACGEAMIEAAKAISAAATKTMTTEAPAAPQPEVTYSFTDVRQAAADASRSGHRADVKALLSKYKVEKLSALAEADYPAFMKDLEEIGNG